MCYSVQLLINFQNNYDGFYYQIHLTNFIIIFVMPCFSIYIYIHNNVRYPKPFFNFSFFSVSHSLGLQYDFRETCIELVTNDFVSVTQQWIWKPIELQMENKKERNSLSWKSIEKHTHTYTHQVNILLRWIIYVENAFIKFPSGFDDKYLFLFLFFIFYYLFFALKLEFLSLFKKKRRIRRQNINHNPS